MPRMENPPPPSAAPGWYPNPSGEANQRYWDGTSWTYVSNATPQPPTSGKAAFPFKPAGIVLGLVLLVALATRIGAGDDRPTAGTSSQPTSSLPSYVAPSYAAPTTTTTTTRTPMTAADFSVEVKVIEQQCFGSAGCLYRYTIDPIYLGWGTPQAATVVYSIQGGDETQVGNFRIDASGTATFDRQTTIEAQDGATLTAVVTEVIEEGR